MKRPGTRQSYDLLLDRIRGRLPGVALRTTFIVGFPGETEADLKDLCSFVTEHCFDHVGVFTYSHEEGTSAYGLNDDVPPQAKAARRATVLRAQKRVVCERNRSRVGTRVRVMVDGSSSDHDLVLKARLGTQAPEIDPNVYLTECDPSSLRPGDLAEVEIVGARDYDLIGRILPSNG
jgi:ribosomal protein S12 methylthiotransferase